MKNKRLVTLLLVIAMLAAIAIPSALAQDVPYNSEENANISADVQCNNESDVELEETEESAVVEEEVSDIKITYYDLPEVPVPAPTTPAEKESGLNFETVVIDGVEYKHIVFDSVSKTPYDHMINDIKDVQETDAVAKIQELAKNNSKLLVLVDYDRLHQTLVGGFSVKIVFKDAVAAEHGGMMSRDQYASDDEYFERRKELKALYEVFHAEMEKSISLKDYFTTRWEMSMSPNLMLRYYNCSDFTAADLEELMKLCERDDVEYVVFEYSQKVCLY